MQTWNTIHSLNERIREKLRERGLISGAEKTVTAFEQVDLTNAQKLDERFHPEDHVIVFNWRFGRTGTGSTGKLYMRLKSDLMIETSAPSVEILKPDELDGISFCRPKQIALCKGDRLQLKANAKYKGAGSFANGEIVTVKKVEKGGEIRLADGRTLPPEFRQFVRGYAVTSYGSQGKTVDHVVLADSAVRAATNAQQLVCQHFPRTKKRPDLHARQSAAS